MKVYPMALNTRETNPARYAKLYPKCKDSPMRCVVVHPRDANFRTYVDGYLYSIEVSPNDGGILKIAYICDRCPTIGVPDMDGHCYVTYGGKRYTNMEKLYMAFLNDVTESEIEETLK